MQRSLWLRVPLLLMLGVPHLMAGVEHREGDTYEISGTFKYWPEKDILATYGNDFDRGEFAEIIFKATALNFDGARDFNITQATLSVKARVQEHAETGKSYLVVDEILERLD